MGLWGQSALITATFLSFFGAFGFYGLQQSKIPSQPLIRGAFQTFVTFLVGLAFILLAVAFVTGDLSLAVVANHSHSRMDLLYRLGATWGHHEGSMLLFVLIYCLYGFAYRDSRPQAFHWFFLGCFLLYVLVTSNPFDQLESVPLEGAELNPILQDPLLMIHPPILYGGYAGLSVPFCLTLSYICSKDKDPNYLISMRASTLIAWALLTLGIALGSFWAYYELGWGGWWFWDPVENASLFPFVFGLCLIHTLHGAKHYPSWDKGVVCLGILSYGSGLLGLVLVRSGLLSSVHAFAEDPLRGKALLVILGISMGIAGALLIKNPIKRPSTVLDLKSRGFLYLIFIILWVAIGLTILLGTVYPLVLDFLADASITVGAPYFNQTVVPMGLVSLLPMACVLGFAWQPLGTGVLLERLQKLGIASLVLMIVLGYTLDFLPLTHLAGLFLGGVIMASVFLRPTKWPLKLAHGGFALSLLGMCFDTGLGHEKTVALRPGDSIVLEGRLLVFKRIERGSEGTYQFERAHVMLQDQATHQDLFTLMPEKRYYPSHQTLTTETAIKDTFCSHLYVVLGGLLPDGRWTFRIATHPWVSLIWMGALLMALGAFLKRRSLRKRQIK